MVEKSHQHFHEGRNTALSTTEPVVSTDGLMVAATHSPGRKHGRRDAEEDASRPSVVEEYFMAAR